MTDAPEHTCDRCFELEARIAVLEEEAGLRVDATLHAEIRKALGLRRAAWHVLMALYGAKGRLLPSWVIDDSLPLKDHAVGRTERVVDVYICSIRKALGYDAIETIRFEGYRLTPAGLATVNALLTGNAPTQERGEMAA